MQDCTDRIVKLFSKLMLEDNVHAVVHLVTERASRGLLDPDTVVSTEQNHSIAVKDPEPCVPPVSALPCCDILPLLEDIEVSGAHVQAVACRIQGGAGPGGCDAAH